MKNHTIHLEWSTIEQRKPYLIQSGTTEANQNCLLTNPVFGHLSIEADIRVGEHFKRPVDAPSGVQQPVESVLVEKDTRGQAN